MLTEMLSNSQDFMKLPVPEQAILIKLASEFQDNTQYMFMNPEELHDTTGIGSKDQWRDLLSRQETISFLKGQMAFLAQISQRKTFQSLVQMALNGNNQAAKQVQELSGAYNQQDNNRVVIMVHIPKKEEPQ